MAKLQACDWMLIWGSLLGLVTGSVLTGIFMTFTAKPCPCLTVPIAPMKPVVNVEQHQGPNALDPRIEYR